MKKKNDSIWTSISHAISGIKLSLKAEKNMFVHFFIMLVVIIFGMVFELNTNEWIICIFLFGLVFALELVNTAIENTVDICSPEFSNKAKIAKDTAAGAVLVVCIIAVIIGLIIFMPKIFYFFR